MKINQVMRIRMAAAGMILLGYAGCQSVYYNTMEKFGVEKRDILSDRVKDAQESQEEAKEQFKTALERFTEVVNFKGGELQSKYDKLSTELERSEKRATEVHDRIASVEQVAGDLFSEWKAELRQYSNDEMRRTSQRQLDETRDRYDDLIAAMKQVEKKIDPVLAVFRDQVLFLKHNLNAKAVASLKDELSTMETDVSALIKEMEESIAEAESFIKTMSADASS